MSFNVTSEFAPGDNVTWWAQAVDPFTNQSLDGVTVEFWENGTVACVANATTGVDGVATATWTSPTDSMSTVVAKVALNQGLANCTLAVQPVTLTVGNDTELLLSAWRDSQGTGHTIYARLVDANGAGLSSQTVTLNMNGTAYPPQTKRARGHFNLSLSTFHEVRFQ